VSGGVVPEREAIWDEAPDDPITVEQARAVSSNWRDTAQLANALDAMTRQYEASRSELAAVEALTNGYAKALVSMTAKKQAAEAQRAELQEALRERDYLVQRSVLRSEWKGLTGRSSDAMVVAAFTGEGPWRTDYPLDRSDWRRCLLAYALAPEHLRERMRPTMRAYRASLHDKHRRGFGRYPFPRTNGVAALASGDGTDECHICKRHRSRPGEVFCSASHGDGTEGAAT
jgi:hypothetical protein